MIDPPPSGRSTNQNLESTPAPPVEVRLTKAQKIDFERKQLEDANE